MLFGKQLCNIKKAIILNSGLIIIVIFYYLFLNIANISCPIKYILGFNCPTCNSTTAILTLLQGDIRGYFNLQPFSLPILVAIILELNRFLFKKPIIIDIYTIIIAVGNFIYYLVNMFVQ